MSVEQFDPNRRRKPAATPATPDTRALVRVEQGEIAVAVDAAVKALPSDPELYQREGALVRVVRAEGAEGRVAWEPGTPQVRAVQPATMRERLTRIVRFERLRHTKNGDTTSKPCDPPENVVHALLERGAYSGVPPLVGVIETPSFRPDGSMIVNAGYDSATGYLFEPQANFEAVSASASREDAEQALAALREVFSDFPCRSDADRDVAIACILTIIARPMIRGAVPAFVFDASTPGSGKSLMTDAIGLIATGRGAARMSWPEKPDELEKVIGAYALAGAALISFDNVASHFEGSALDRALTATDRVQLRILGKSELATMPWRAVVLATGNNMSVRGDTRRRVLVSRLEPDVERPEERSGFQHADLLKWVRAERPRLVRAAMSLIAAFVDGGRPKGGSTWGSFEQWAEVVPAAIRFAGGANVLDSRLAAAEGQDAETGALVPILDALERLDVDGKGLTVRALLERLYPPDRIRPGNASPVPDRFDDAREALESITSQPTFPGKSPVANAVGKAFGKLRGRVIGGRRLERRGGARGILRWFAKATPTAGGVGGVGGVIPNPTRIDSEKNDRGTVRNTPSNPSHTSGATLAPQAPPTAIDGAETEVAAEAACILALSLERQRLAGGPALGEASPTRPLGAPSAPFDIAGLADTDLARRASSRAALIAACRGAGTIAVAAERLGISDRGRQLGRVIDGAADGLPQLVGAALQEAS